MQLDFSLFTFNFSLKCALHLNIFYLQLCTPNTAAMADRMLMAVCTMMRMMFFFLSSIIYNFKVS